MTEGAREAASGLGTTAAPLVVPRDAATIVLVRAGRHGPEVLLTRRPDTMAFAPGMHVFPGGAVDARDRAEAIRPELTDAAEKAAIALAEADAPTALACHLAAVREAREEVGLELGLEPGHEVGVGDGIAPSRLRPTARWITPPSFARRFDTRFFVAVASPDVALTLDPHEVVDAHWTTPRAALDARAAGELALWLPTACVLALLDDAVLVTGTDVNGFLDALPRPARPRPFRASPIADDVVRLDLPSIGAVPGRAGVGWLVGRRKVVAVDPGDPDPADLDAILASAAELGREIAAVVVTRVDPDHAAGAFDLANRLGVPSFCGPGAARRLPIPFEELEIGDAIPAGDVPVRVSSADDPRYGGFILSTASGWSAGPSSRR